MPAHNAETRDWSELAAAVGGLAHEIKNPLSTINMNLGLLKEDLADPKTPAEIRSRRKLDAIQREIARLDDILNSFLRFVRIDKAETTQTSINDVINGLLQFVTPEAAAQGVEIVKFLDPNLPPIQLDAKLFRQALLNLVMNAKDAMEQGGQLTVRTGLEDGHILIELTDTGGGIAPGALPKIFDVYYSTKSHGTGLGLPTTRWIIKQHGGTIQAQSEQGKGTRFIIHLPIANTEE